MWQRAFHSIFDRVVPGLTLPNLRNAKLTRFECVADRVRLTGGGRVSASVAWRIRLRYTLQVCTRYTTVKIRPEKQTYPSTHPLIHHYTFRIWHCCFLVDFAGLSVCATHLQSSSTLRLYAGANIRLKVLLSPLSDEKSESV